MNDISPESLDNSLFSSTSFHFAYAILVEREKKVAHAHAHVEEPEKDGMKRRDKETE